MSNETSWPHFLVHPVYDSMHYNLIMVGCLGCQTILYYTWASECYRKAIFGHASRLTDDVTANLALRCQVDSSLGHCLSHYWSLHCLDAVSSWMAANRLQLNSDMTEALWCSSVRRQYQIPTRPVRVGCTSVQPVTVVRNLGIYLDGDVTLLQLSGHALPSYAKYAVCIVPCHVQPC